MNSKSGQHDREHLDLVFLYALQALPTSEIQAVEAHISSCADCRQEIETLRPTIDFFVSWPTDLLRPSVSLWGRLAQRIGEDTGEEMVPPPSQLPAQPEWEEAAPGIACKLLAIDTEKNRLSMLVRLAPGTDYPPHRHAGVGSDSNRLGRCPLFYPHHHAGMGFATHAVPSTHLLADRAMSRYHADKTPSKIHEFAA